MALITISITAAAPATKDIISIAAFRTNIIGFFEGVAVLHKVLPLLFWMSGLLHGPLTETAKAGVLNSRKAAVISDNREARNTLIYIPAKVLLDKTKATIASAVAAITKPTSA